MNLARHALIDHVLESDEWESSVELGERFGLPAQVVGTILSNMYGAQESKVFDGYPPEYPRLAKDRPDPIGPARWKGVKSGATADLR
jgi:hypothetical protein